jgi:hypothetical protein
MNKALFGGQSAIMKRDYRQRNITLPVTIAVTLESRPAPPRLRWQSYSSCARPSSKLPTPVMVVLLLRSR